MIWKNLTHRYKNACPRGNLSHAGQAFFIYAGSEPKSVLTRDLGDYRNNLRNSRSVFLIVNPIISATAGNTEQQRKSAVPASPGSAGRRP